jgi:hypothetical protein
MTTLNRAIQDVDLKALAAGDQTKFDFSLAAADARLQALKPLLTQATFHLTGNSHIDAAWLWPWTETVDVVKRTFGTALQLMYEYPDYTYTQSAAAYNEWMAQKYPEMNDEIKRAHQGRPLGDRRRHVGRARPQHARRRIARPPAPRRQALVQAGIRRRCPHRLEPRFSFGYTWQLPQIYKKSGVDYFVTQKMTWNDTNQLPFKLFWWESPDGSKVLTYFPHDYVNLDNLNPDRLSQRLATARNRATGMTDMMDLYGIGDHGGGPPAPSSTRVASHWVHPSHVTPKYAVRHRAGLVHRRRKTDRPGQPRVELPIHCQGLHRASARQPRSGEHSHLEVRALLRIPPRRDDLAGQPQAQHARRRGAGAQRREVLLNRVALWLRSIPRRRSPKIGRRCSSTSSTTSPPAPASASSTKTRRKTTT